MGIFIINISNNFDICHFNSTPGLECFRLSCKQPHIRPLTKAYPIALNMFLFVWDEALRPSQHFFSHVGTETPLPEYYQSFWGGSLNMHSLRNEILNIHYYSNITCISNGIEIGVKKCISSCKHVRVIKTLYTPLLYSKIGVYRGLHFFLIFALKYISWVRVIRTASLRRFSRVPTIYILS